MICQRQRRVAGTLAHVVAVYDGRECQGCVLSRGAGSRRGATDRSLGIFPSQRKAAAAIMAAE